MRMAALHLCVLALLALTGGAFARPTEEGAQANSVTFSASSLANCPHPPQSNVTGQQAQGIWYVLEGIYPRTAFDKDKKYRARTCILCNFTFEDTRLTIFARMGDGDDDQRTWTFDPAPGGMWAEEGTNATVHLSTTTDQQLLLMCLMSDGDVLSFVLGRSPLLDEAAIAAARSPPFSSARALRPDLQSCDALTAADSASAAAAAAAAASSSSSSSAST